MHSNKRISYKQHRFAEPLDPLHLIKGRRDRYIGLSTGHDLYRQNLRPGKHELQLSFWISGLKLGFKFLGAVCY